MDSRNIASGKEPIYDRSSSPLVKKRRRRKKAPSAEAERLVKRQKFLERNRIAANKSWQKKREQIDSLESKFLEIEKEIAALKIRLSELWDEFNLWKDAIMAHTPCNHPDVIRWIELKTACAFLSPEWICPALVDSRPGGVGTDSNGCR